VCHERQDGGVLREMRVWPLGFWLQDLGPNYVELLR